MSDVAGEPQGGKSRDKTFENRSKPSAFLKKVQTMSEPSLFMKIVVLRGSQAPEQTLENDFYFEDSKTETASLLLIAGLASDDLSWTFQKETLAQEFRLITFDNRGLGGAPLLMAPTPSFPWPKTFCPCSTRWGYKLICWATLWGERSLSISPSSTLTVSIAYCSPAPSAVSQGEIWPFSRIGARLSPTVKGELHEIGNALFPGSTPRTS